MEIIDSRITCAFLYTITKYGYPPQSEGMTGYIREMAALGFKSIEIEGIGNDGISTLYKNKESIRQVIADADVDLPIFCTVLPKLASVSEDLAARDMESFEMGCETAAFLGAHGVLDNGPLVPYAFPKDMPIHRHYAPEVISKVSLPEDFSWHEYQARLIAIMQRACDIAAKFGLDYYMHPCLGSQTDTTDAYLLLKKEVGRGNLKFCYDTSNLYYMHENMALGLMKLAAEIDYIHISDSFGTKIEHQPIGNGDLNWELFFEILKKINYQGQLAIDVGGDESHVADIEAAYLTTARFLQEKLAAYEI